MRGAKSITIEIVAQISKDDKINYFPASFLCPMVQFLMPFIRSYVDPLV